MTFCSHIHTRCIPVTAHGRRVDDNAPLDLRRHRQGDETFENLTAANISVGVRAYCEQASIGRISHGVISPPMAFSFMGSLASMISSPNVAMGNAMSDGGFHSPSAGIRNDFRYQLRSIGPVVDDNVGGDSRRAVGSAVNARHNLNIHMSALASLLSLPLLHCNISNSNKSNLQRRCPRLSLRL